MIWFFYNILFSIVYVLMLPYFFLRMFKRGGYSKGFFQRLGFYGVPLYANLRSRRRVWIHAVSVGEMYIALRFMDEVRNCRPETAFVLTTTTSTGHAIAEKRVVQSDVLLYFPADFPFIIKRFLDCLNPLALILVESELWPNMIRLARKRNIPIMLLNGRISNHSYRGYKKLRPLVKRILGCFDLLCVQSDEDSHRLIDLGADPERVEIMGSGKYDVANTASEQAAKSGEALRNRIFSSNTRLLVGGSTWPGEEKILIEIYKSLRDRFQDLRLVLTPRHVERAREVISEIKTSGLSFLRRSEIDEGRAQQSLFPDVLLVDTTGELNIFYSIATVIFVGKSLTSKGGQNVIEPAVFAKPIVVGPHMENFASVTDDFFTANALIQVQDKRGLKKAILELWNDDEARQGYGSRARQVVLDKAGAIPASVKRYLSLMK